MEPQSSELNYQPPRRTERPLRLLLDGRKLGDGGIGVYTENLIQGLLATNSVDVSIISHPDKITKYHFGGDVTWVPDTASPYSVDEMLGMPRRIDFKSYDVFHTPHYMLPFGIPIKKVVTVHDLIHVTHPERFYYPLVARTLISSAASRADKIIAVSNDTREQILQRLAVAPDKVVWIPNAVQLRDESAPQVRSGLQRKICDLKPYILGVFSNVKPHKGFTDLLEAFQQVRSEYISRQGESSAGLETGVNWRALKLVLVGSGTEDVLESSDLLQKVAGCDSVHVLGKVNHQELTFLYEGARCLAVPSYTEGFCLPAIEAQAAGTRVVSRPVPAIQEIAGPHDVIATDFSLQTFAAALAHALSRPLLTEEEKQNRRSRLGRFSRERTAEESLRVYQALVGQGSGI